MQIPVIVQTTGLLIMSNVFMTIAWYGHLKNLSSKTWWIAALVSWSIALFEYLLQVPANRIGYTQYSLAQLKILQEALTLIVFVPFAMFIWGSRSNSITSGQAYVWSARFILFSGIRAQAPDDAVSDNPDSFTFGETHGGIFARP
jgi:uncharacterized protein (DUF486 family)